MRHLNSRIKRYYYHRDHQNSIIALSDENAQIVEYYEYDIYGTITKSEKIAKTLNPYGYTGRETDADDLYYYRARYYDPTIGRFITPDPIGFLSGDTNFYRYVGNDPVNFVDPNGLAGTGYPQNPSQNTLSSAFDSFNNSIQNFFSPNPTNSSATVNKEDGGKSKADEPPIIPNIIDAYFAKLSTRDKPSGTTTYTFVHQNNVSTSAKKNDIAKIIYNKIKDKSTPKYPTLASVEEALTKDDKYNAGESVTIKQFEPEKYYQRITEASIGQKVFLVAQLNNGFKPDKNVTFKIYEKDTMLVTSGKELMVLKDDAQMTEITTKSLSNFTATVEVELRPKKDRKSSPTDTSPSLELWKEKFAGSPEKIDNLWINVSSPAATHHEKDCLKGNELKVKGGCITVDQFNLIFPNTTTEYYKAINETMCQFEINTLLRKSHFLAQVAHKTGQLRYKEEIASGERYEGATRLGNTQEGDGKRFKGRGLLQLTGRTNYTDFET